MSFQVTVREIKPVVTKTLADLAAVTEEQRLRAATDHPVDRIYEQTVEVLDMPRLIAAVNYKPRVRRQRTVAASATPARS